MFATILIAKTMQISGACCNCIWKGRTMRQDGERALELARALRKSSDIPILILSARNPDNDKIWGADDYIAKPIFLIPTQWWRGVWR